MGQSISTVIPWHNTLKSGETPGGADQTPEPGSSQPKAIKCKIKKMDNNNCRNYSVNGSQQKNIPSTNFKLKAGDEVCILKEGDLVFGTLEHPVTRINNVAKKPAGSQSSSKESTQEKDSWVVRWVHDPSMSVPEEVDEKDLMPTDRTVYKGCKVRSTEKNTGKAKEGICRSVFYQADLRIVGTNTIIPKVKIDEFSHLKNYKQKSVVHYKGWLGVISAVQRLAVIDHDGTEEKVKLEQVNPPNPFGIESPWIQEQCYPMFLTSSSKSVASTSKQVNNDSVKRARRIAYIKDLIVESVKVIWHHQIDAEYPDKPKMEFKNGTHTQLRLVKEDVCTDDSTFSFEVGNLGRYKITNHTEFIRWDVWQKGFAITNLTKYNPVIAFQLRKDYSELDTSEISKTNSLRAYAKETADSDSTDANKMFELGKTVVVEIVHVQCAADVQWQDGSSDIPNSSLDLEVVEETMLHSTKCLVPGDFIYSRQLNYKSSDAYFVILKEEEDAGVKKLVVRVLDANVPGKVLKISEKLELSPSSRMLKVERHPVYQYFNESTTIVVVNEDSEGDRGAVPLGNIRIGHVIGTNLMGKVNVRFHDTGREEWVWPQVCAIYSVKKFDLECVKSHITDNDSDPETKLRMIMENLKKKVELVWKNDSKSESDLKESLSDFAILVSSFENLISRVNRDLPQVKFQSAAYNNLEVFLRKPVGVGREQRPSYFKSEPRVLSVVLNAVDDLQKQGEQILSELMRMAKSASTAEENNDIMMETPQPSSSSASDIDLENMFSKTVVVLESHPEGHHYSRTTKFTPQHHKCFLKTVKEELERLDKICSTEMQSQMGILTKAFTDRMDLLSILIRGPEGTPYEDSIYLFDACLPQDYPNSPPKFHFHSFSAGRLNPNLYAEGKVCVSLLGTWSGRDEREKWTKDSNIVQILLSIQGLILVKDPYHNEPGLEADKYDSATAKKLNLTYNLQLMPLVIRMMINQISFKSEPWEDEVRMFYKHRVPIFLSRWRKWISAKSEKYLHEIERPGFEIYPMTSDFKTKMKPMLKDLENLWETKLK